LHSWSRSPTRTRSPGCGCSVRYGTSAMSVGYSDRAGPSSCEHDACQSLPLSSTVAGGSLVRLAHPG